MSDVLDVLATGGAHGRLDAASPAAGAASAVADDAARADGEQVMVETKANRRDLELVTRCRL